jgi:hypothetical protein
VFSNGFARESALEMLFPAGMNLSMWRRNGCNLLRRIAKTIDLDNAKYRARTYEEVKVCASRSQEDTGNTPEFNKWHFGRCE